jgi:hypothetical protein
MSGEMTVRVIRPSDRRGRRGVLATVESTASVFFAFVVGLVVVTAGGLAAFLSYRERGMTWVLPAGLAVAAAEVVSLAWLKAGLELPADRARVPELALRQPRWPIALRPLVAGWWLAHAAVGGGAMWLLEQAGALEELWSWRGAVLLPVVLFGLFTISHTTHLYAMSAIASLGGSRRWVDRWWRARFAVDALAVAAALVAIRL